MTGYPPSAGVTNQLAPVPRRIRAYVGGRVILDTTAAVYVWEWPKYPQYYIPLADIDSSVLVDEHYDQKLSRGTARRHGLRVGDIERPAALRVYGAGAMAGLDGMVRVEWGAVDAWFEEDEQVFVHPRDPYTRVDALRSTRHVRVELDGSVLAESASPVLVFETGLPTRFYLDRTDVDFAHLEKSDTVSECPYKGTTGGYWTARIGDRVHKDLAWTYQFPTRQLQPIAGLIAFYNEKVDTIVDGILLERPVTHFS